ncbi:MAG: hypothetical protein FWG02_10640, partial [Holophagaceae bacterium]|nr:hypothetical protein [Holophagaceae bacterium]
RIDNGANLLKDHIFQFDFLNDEFSKLPLQLQKIINDTEKRKKLVIYINPPYAEADNRKGEKRSGVAVSEIHTKYSKQMGYAKRELYIQFLTRIYQELNGVILANFSKLKNLQAPRFSVFRSFFKARLEKLFISPANTFDNVAGDFPIGFMIWNTGEEAIFDNISADVFDCDGECIESKTIHSFDEELFINDWVKIFRVTNSDSIATIIGVASDFQNQRLVRFGEPHMKVPADNHNWQVSKDNLIETSIYYSVRKIIPATWLNDRDQFLHPKDNWQADTEFHTDCLTFTLFVNGIQSAFGTNSWMPFTENEVNARTKFDSSFMTDFIAGKIKPDHEEAMVPGSLQGTKKPNAPLEFSATAKSVFDAGRELWKYYHAQPNVNVNASLYDIREHFKGRNEKGRMNAKSEDENFNLLDSKLRDALKALGRKIEPKVYEYGFLKR